MLPVAAGIGDGGQWCSSAMGNNQLCLHFLRPNVCPGLQPVLAMQPLMAGGDTRLNTALAPGREFQAGNTQFSMRFIRDLQQ